jgi:endonuclease/exonuclease/phosphatase family metal-dependent hydrolase
MICGDFNDWRNALAGGLMQERGLRHVTHPPSRFRSFPAYFPLGSLDKAFCCEAIRVAEARIVGGSHANAASDHRPLVIDFHLNGHGPR